MKKEIGKVYKHNEPTVSLELNLEDLYWVQSLVPYGDGFRKELQEGIDYIEHRNAIVEEGYGLEIVVAGVEEKEDE